MSLVRQACLKLFFHNALFKAPQERVSSCVRTQGADGQYLRWMACSQQVLPEQQPPVSSLAGAVVMVLDDTAREKSRS